jgi:branched-chain amino acid transport system ATP-binding protein
MLEVEDLHAGYGYSQVLFGVSLNVAEGEIVGMLGRNGMGKTTTVKALFGLLAATKGSIRFRGEDLAGRPPHRIARAGLGLVPEGRQIFPLLTVDQNLAAMERPRGGNIWDRRRVYEFFPQLGARADQRGDRLSGGEQQMLAIGRALVMNPDLLVLDEAAEGLAPSLRREIWPRLARLRSEGRGILLIDGHVSEVLDLADRAVIMEKGRIVWEGSADDLADSPEVRRAHLGVG